MASAPNTSTAPARPRLPRRMSMASDSSESSSPERELYDDGDSIMEHANDSQSSLGVSLEDMDLDLDRSDFEEQCRVTPISRLPAELLITIFAKLPTASDVCHCMLVCKSWARNGVDLLWHRPDTRNWDKLLVVMDSVRSGRIFPYSDLIKRFNLASLGEQISDGTLIAMSNCKRIERLTLTNCRKLTDLGVAELIKGNRNLLAIDCTNLDEITDVSLNAIADNCYRLQGLNVTKCTKITDESLVAIARNCRRLKRLKFNDCTQLTDYSIMAFADHCHDILEIDCAGCINLTDESVTALIKEGRQLRELRLPHCQRLTDQAFIQLPVGARYDALRILDMTDCHELQDQGLQCIIDAAPKLRNLVLAKCRQITDQGVRAVTSLGKNLHYIHLGHCGRITDAGVLTLVHRCQRIRYIDLACCGHLTDQSVSALAYLPKLKRIGLVKCQLITDASLEALATPRKEAPNMLERLHLSYCTQLSVAGVKKMLVNCPRLTHLSLTGVNEFLNPQYLQFCREAPPEFNEHQREMFCVYSGDGVNQLRAYLRLNGPPDENDSTSFDQDGPVREGQYPHSYHSQLPFNGPFRPSHAQPLPPYNGQHQQHHHHGQQTALLPPGPPHYVLPPQFSSSQYSLLHHVSPPLVGTHLQYGQQQHQMGPPPPPPPPAHAHMPPHTAHQGQQGPAQVPLALTGDDGDVDDEDVDGDGDEDMRAGDD